MERKRWMNGKNLVALCGFLVLMGCGTSDDDGGEDTSVDAAVEDTGAATDTQVEDTQQADTAAPADTGATVDSGAAADTKPVKKESCNGIDDDGDGETDEDTCDDDDPCTEDSCDGDKKQCSSKVIPEGGECDDGDACTSGDVCEGGKCVSKAATKCDDGDPCTIDLCDAEVGFCTHTKQADGATCDDGDPCTLEDSCTGGTCAGAKQKDCDDSDSCTKDSCDSTKGCVNSPDDGAACDDGDLCTKNDVCGDGKCAGELPAECQSQGSCEIVKCDPQVGLCSKSTETDGTACDDGDACTKGTACKAGACVGGDVTTCAGGTPCAPNICNTKSGKCETNVIADGGACDDGNPCTTKETCQFGKCIDISKLCNDDNPCTDDSCKPGVGCENKANTAQCEDGDPCTVDDACSAGACAGGKKKDCSDGTDCTLDSCEPGTGICKNDAAPQEGKSCDDDGDACTANETCTKGVCGGGQLKTCKDDNPCTADTCDSKTGACTFPASNVGATCDDGSLCTFSDACDDKGKCTGKSFSCSDGKPCTTDSCNAKTGKCEFAAKKAGDACDDGDACSEGDACDAQGSCKPKQSKKCDDGNVCTTDSCDSKTGKCINKANTGPCDDGSICTSGDTCIDGKCQPGLDGFTSTVAGTGSSAVINGPGNKASFSDPRGITADAKGGLYVADRNAHRIRYIDSKFNVTTAAGSGSYGYKDGPAGSASFRYPMGVAYDSKKSTLYIADTSSHCVRKLDGGNVSVVVGKCGTSSAYYGYKEGQATQAKLYFPEGLAVNDSGLLYIADRANHAVRIYNGIGTQLAAGTPGSAKYKDGPATQASFNSPTAVSLAANGAVFIADAGNHRIRALRPDGVVVTVAGSSAGFQDGYKTQARFSSPNGVLWTKGGVLYVTDGGNHRIRKVLLDGTVSTFTGSLPGWVNGAAKAARFNYPRGLTRGQSGSLFITDGSNRRIRKVDLGQLVCTDDDPCTADKCDPTKGCTNAAIAQGKPCEDGALCVTGGTCGADGKCSGGKPKCANGGPCVQNVCETLSGTCLAKSDGAACDDGDKCTSGEICAQGKCAATIRQLSVLSGSGSSGIKDGQGAAAMHQYPRGMSTDDVGNIYLAEYSGHRVRRVSAQGTVKVVAGSSYGFKDGAAATAQFRYPCDVVWTPTGDLFVADRTNHRIRKVSASGSVSTLAGSTAGFTDGAGSSARFYYPESIAFDNKSQVLYVADSYNNRIRKVTLGGVVTNFIGSGTSSYKEGTGTGAWVYRPTGVAVGSDGTVYFSSYYHHMIRKATPAGKTSLLAGATSYGFVNGTGSSARFRYPADIAVDANNNVYVADRANHSIRKVSPSGQVTTHAGTGSSGMTNGVATSNKMSNPYGVAVFGDTVYVGDSSNNRVRAIRLPVKDCNDGNSCTVDSCDAKTAKCSHKAIVNCCSPLAGLENFKEVSIASKMKFFTCQPQKFDVVLKSCKEDKSGLSPKLGWQVASPALIERSGPGALYYGSSQFGNYNWGPNAGKVITAPMKVPNTKKTTLRFWVYFDTEAAATLDRLYAYLQVDGKRVQLGDGKAPAHGAAWYKGQPGYTTAKSWSEVQIDVSAYAGKQLALEFEFNTGDGLKNYGLGVGIDDISLLTVCD